MRFGFESGAGASTSAVLVQSVYVQNIVNVCLGWNNEVVMMLLRMVSLLLMTA
jgi:hypothetical protein